jgi:hypothetical protein
LRMLQMCVLYYLFKLSTFVEVSTLTTGYANAYNRASRATEGSVREL